MIKRKDRTRNREPTHQELEVKEKKKAQEIGPLKLKMQLEGSRPAESKPSSVKLSRVLLVNHALILGMMS